MNCFFGVYLFNKKRYCYLQKLISKYPNDVLEFSNFENRFLCNLQLALDIWDIWHIFSL